MAVPSFSMRELIESGVHFGHKTRRWNPQMAPFIFGVRNDTHIIDLGQTVPMLHRALQAVHEVAAAGGKILFVGTKRQASDIISEAAKSCGQYYINERWLGGLMTNWKTIQASIKRLKVLEEQLGDEEVRQSFTKKELLNMERARLKLEKSLGGIKTIGRTPDLLFIIDTNREDLAVQEANRLNIPIVGIVDTNATVEGISFPIPGNDDATRAIRLYSRLIADTINEGRASAGLDKASVEEATFTKAPAKKAEAPAEAETKTTAKTKKEAVADAAKAEEKPKKAAAKKAPAKKVEVKDDAKAEDKPKKAAAKKAPAKKAEAAEAKDDAKAEDKPKKAAAKKAPAKKDEKKAS